MGQVICKCKPNECCDICEDKKMEEAFAAFDPNDMTGYVCWDCDQEICVCKREDGYLIPNQETIDDIKYDELDKLMVLL